MATTKMIQSLERGFAILELLGSSHEELSVKEISDALGLNKSTAFGLIHTLTRLGYLEQNDQNQKYTLGIKILSLSNAVRVHSIIIRAVRPHLERISHQFGETAHCAVEQGDSVIYLDKVEVQNSVYINTQIGTKNYLHCTGVGKCILAYMNRERQDRILSGHMRTMTYNTITNAERMREELNSVVRNGFAEDNEEIELGLSCVAVPVFSSANQVACAISLSGLTQRMANYGRDQIVKALQDASMQISQSLYSYIPSQEFHRKNTNSN